MRSAHPQTRRRAPRRRSRVAASSGRRRGRRRIGTRRKRRRGALRRFVRVRVGVRVGVRVALAFARLRLGDFIFIFAFSGGNLAPGGGGVRRISSSRTTSTSRASRAIFRRVRGLATADHCALHERPLACLRGEDAKPKPSRRDATATWKTSSTARVPSRPREAASRVEEGSEGSTWRSSCT